MVHNKVILMGRLTKDAMIVPPKSEDQKPIAHFSLAVDRYKGKDGESTADFFRCNAYGQRAEFLEKFGKKGVKFAIEGHLTTGSYEKDGVKVNTVEIDVENIEFCEKKDSGNAAEGGDGFVEAPDNAQDEMPFR